MNFQEIITVPNNFINIFPSVYVPKSSFRLHTYSFKLTSLQKKKSKITSIESSYCITKPIYQFTSNVINSKKIRKKNQTKKYSNEFILKSLAFMLL